jgi:hypothetical protein
MTRTKRLPEAFVHDLAPSNGVKARLVTIGENLVFALEAPYRYALDSPTQGPIDLRSDFALEGWAFGLAAHFGEWVEGEVIPKELGDPITNPTWYIQIY